MTDEAEVSRPSVLAAAQVAMLVIGALVFGGLFLVGCFVSFAVGGLTGGGYLIAQVGQIWLLVLIVRECRSDAIIFALVIPFFTWYFAFQRWDIANWAFACNVVGILLSVMGAYVRA